MPETLPYSYNLTKETIKEDIDKSNNYEELYKNSIDILQKMESSFSTAVFEKGDRRNPMEWASGVKYSIFDNKLDTSNPITIFEKKGAELLQRAKDIEEENRVLKASIELALGVAGIGNGQSNSEKEFQDAKDKVVDELYETYTNAIDDFVKDFDEDGMIDRSNNIDYNGILSSFLEIFKHKGTEIFWMKEHVSTSEFANYVKNLNDFDLLSGTFNIRNGSGAFDYCYAEIKNRFGSKNLFSVIDSVDIDDYNKKALIVSVIQSFTSRKKIDDLVSYMEGYNDTDALINIVKDCIQNDTLKMSLLTSFDELMEVELFKPIMEVLQQDSKVKKLLEEESTSFDNVDVFNSRKINALFLYDNEGHGGGRDYFYSEVNQYKSKGFVVDKKDITPNYEKIVLKKGEHQIVMLKINGAGNLTTILKNILRLENILNSILENDLGKENFNLFALRGHCYTTEIMAKVLGKHNMVDEGDILIDGGCYNAKNVELYHKSGIKGYMFGYTGQGRGFCTDDFINRLISAVDTGKTFEDVLSYYNNYKGDESSNAGYFARKVVRPDSMYVRYYSTD